jgi:hypothetical protein
MSTSAVSKCAQNPIRYSDISASLWLWSGAPVSWRNRVDLRLHDVGFFELEPANTLKHWDVLAWWTRLLSEGRAIPPIIVSRTEHGSLYVHDGNHRLAAMRIRFRNRLSKLRVRVAVLEPRPGYVFRYRWFGQYGTYVLEPENKLLVRSEAAINPFGLYATGQPGTGGGVCYSV